MGTCASRDTLKGKFAMESNSEEQENSDEGNPRMVDESKDLSVNSGPNASKRHRPNAPTEPNSEEQENSDTDGDPASQQSIDDHDYLYTNTGPKRKRRRSSVNPNMPLLNLQSAFSKLYDELNTKQLAAELERDKTNIACQKSRIKQKLNLIDTKLAKIKMEAEMNAMRQEIAKLKSENKNLRKDREIWEKEKDILMAMTKPLRNAQRGGGAGKSGQRQEKAGK